MLRVGLTGGIASGKSTVAGLFVELGARLIDTDVVAREVVKPGSEALAAIRDAFGPEFLTSAGELDRARMRATVFADAAQRHRLEAILHPLIRRRTLELAAASPGPYVLIAVPLLVETGFGALVDRVLVVDCAESIQLERLMRRDGVDEAAARAILAAQVDRRTRLAAADDVVDNTGDLAATRRRVATLHAQYLKLSGNC